MYKLMLYEDGGFIKSHKDTKKEPSMFGSLVVQLPVRHDHGALAVRHHGEEALFDFGGDGSNAYFYLVALYADCKHELHPVENGKRLCLLYNLVRGGGAAVRRPRSCIVMRCAIDLLKLPQGGSWIRMLPGSFASLLNLRSGLYSM